MLLLDLPNDLLLAVVTATDSTATITSLACTCSRLRSLSANESVWQAVSKLEQWPQAPEATWRATVKNHARLLQSWRTGTYLDAVHCDPRAASYQHASEVHKDQPAIVRLAGDVKRLPISAVVADRAAVLHAPFISQPPESWLFHNRDLKPGSKRLMHELDYQIEVFIREFDAIERLIVLPSSTACRNMGRVDPEHLIEPDTIGEHAASLRELVMRGFPVAWAAAWLGQIAGAVCQAAQYAAFRCDWMHLIKGDPCFRQLRRLDVSRSPGERLVLEMSDAVNGILENCPQLLFLAVRNAVRLVELRLDQLCEHKTLRHADLSGCGAGGWAYEAPWCLKGAVGPISSLTEVVMNGCADFQLFQTLPCSHMTVANCPHSQLAARLTRLELRNTSCLSASTLAAILLHCTALRHFVAPDLKEKGTEEALMAALGAATQQLPYAASLQLPSLLSLEVGWGCGGRLALELCRSSSFLANLTIRLGAEMSDWALREIAAACPHLQKLALRFATVSDEGVGAVLRGCRQLTSLQLLQCVGPFTDALGAAWASQRRLLPLAELKLDGGAAGVTDAGLAALLDRQQAQLRSLRLVGLTRLTPAILPHLQQHAPTLEDLHLVGCGGAPEAGTGLAVPSAAGLSTDACELEALLAECRTLRRLCLQRCGALEPAPMLQLPRRCALLKHIILDGADACFPALRDAHLTGSYKGTALEGVGNEPTEYEPDLF